MRPVENVLGSLDGEAAAHVNDSTRLRGLRQRQQSKGSRARGAEQGEQSKGETRQLSGSASDRSAVGRREETQHSWDD